MKKLFIIFLLATSLKTYGMDRKVTGEKEVRPISFVFPAYAPAPAISKELSVSPAILPATSSPMPISFSFDMSNKKPSTPTSSKETKTSGETKTRAEKLKETAKIVETHSPLLPVLSPIVAEYATVPLTTFKNQTTPFDFRHDPMHEYNWELCLEHEREETVPRFCIMPGEFTKYPITDADLSYVLRAHHARKTITPEGKEKYYRDLGVYCQSRLLGTVVKDKDSSELMIHATEQEYFPSRLIETFYLPAADNTFVFHPIIKIHRGQRYTSVGLEMEKPR